MNEIINLIIEEERKKREREKEKRLYLEIFLPYFEYLEEEMEKEERVITIEL